MNKFNLFFLFLLLSCSAPESKHAEVINIDFEDAYPFPPSDSIECKFIALETTEKCLLSGVKQIEFIDDKIYLTDNRYKQMLIFDNSGKFITQVGNAGSGPGEYIMPGCFYVDDRNISIVDHRQNKLLLYDSKTYKYISSEEMFNISGCAWLTKDTIAWLNLSGFDNAKREHFYINVSDSKLNNLASFLPAKFRSSYGILTGNNFYQYEGHTYLSIQFLPVVYKLTSREAIPIYNISFGKDQLPSEEWLSNNVGKSKDHTKKIINSPYISAYNLGETKNYLGTTYYANGQNFYISLFNKETGYSYKSTAYDFMKKYDLYGMSPIKGTYNDYFVVSLNMSDLKRFPIQSQTLRSIVDRSSEEDNPIICLFKFK